MPTYEYRCKDCDHEFELVQKMTDDPLTDCPECGGSVKRLIGTGAGIIFKGSGFYQTDYRSEGYKKEAAKANQSEKDTGSTADSSAKSSTTEGSGKAKNTTPKSTANTNV